MTQFFRETSRPSWRRAESEAINYCVNNPLGVALHALSLNATIVTVAVIDSGVFDFLFREAAHVNTEGEVVVRWGDKEGHILSFDEVTVNRFLNSERLVSSTAITGLSLAWRHRADILDPTG